MGRTSQYAGIERSLIDTAWSMRNKVINSAMENFTAGHLYSLHWTADAEL